MKNIGSTIAAILLSPFIAATLLAIVVTTAVVGAVAVLVSKEDAE